MSRVIYEDPGLHPVPSEKYPSVLPQVYAANNSPNDPNDGIIPVYEIPEVSRSEKQAGKRYLGFRPKRFIILLILILLIVVGVIGGAVGGVLGSRHSSKEDTNNSSKGAEATSTSNSHASATGSSIPEAIDAVAPRARQITACETPDSIFVIHQDEKGDLLMRAYHAKLEKWLEPKRLNTTIPALLNTPLTSTCWRWSDYTDIRVYYLAEEDESYSQIVARCPIDGSGCYAFDYTSNHAVKPSKNGGIAMTSPQPYQLKFYGLDENGTIMEHTWDQKESFAPWVPTEGLPKAHANSPLAVGMNYDELNLVWFDEEHNLLTSQASLKSSGEVVSWSPAHNITEGKAPVIPLELGLAISEDPNVAQVFYLKDSGFASFARGDDKWREGSIPSTIPQSTLDQGPIAAVGWNNTSVRLYYFVGEDIVELLYEPALGWKQGDF